MITIKDKRFLILIIAISIIVISLIADYFLSSKNQKSTQEIPLPKQTKVEPPVKLEIDLKPIISQYDTENFRDPFAPLIIKRHTGQKYRFPLENYDIEELKLAGIVSDNKLNLALIQTPDGKFHIVKDNDKVGPMGGIIKIGKDSIEIKEPPSEIGSYPKIKQLKLRMEEER